MKRGKRKMRAVVEYRGFLIRRAHGGFDCFDSDQFNSWGSALGFVTLRQAIAWCSHAHEFKKGRTYLSCPEWLEAEGARAMVAAYEAKAWRGEVAS